MRAFELMESAGRKFYVSGFPNKRGKFRITGVTKVKNKNTSGDSFEIEMGKNAVTFMPQYGKPLRFRDNQGKPMSIYDIEHLMNSDTEEVTEAKGLGKKVEIIRGRYKGQIGWIREIHRNGPYKGAPKSYYIDLENGEQANNLPPTALRLVKDAVKEDDFFGDVQNSRKDAEKDVLSAFVEQWVDNTYGIPPASYTVNGYKDIRVSLPRDKGPRITHDSVKSGEMKFELRRDAHDLIEELRIAEWGDYEVGTLSAFHFELQKKDDLMASRGQLPKAQQRIRKHKLR